MFTVFVLERKEHVGDALIQSVVKFIKNHLQLSDALLLNACLFVVFRLLLLSQFSTDLSGTVTQGLQKILFCET